MAGYANPWPAEVFPARSLFHPENQSRSGGLSLTGSEQVIASNASRWRARLVMPVLSDASVLAWRAFVSLMEGRAGTALVPKWDNYGVLDMNGRQFGEEPIAAYGDGVLNFDLTGFGQSDDQVHAQLAASAALGATRLSVTVNNGEGPRPGQYIGIADRLYMVQAAWKVAPEDSLRLQVWPRLRASASIGARVILDRPVCLMRFATDQTGELELDMGRWGAPGLEMVEAI